MGEMYPSLPQNNYQQQIIEDQEQKQEEKQRQEQPWKPVVDDNAEINSKKIYYSRFASFFQVDYYFLTSWNNWKPDDALENTSTVLVDGRKQYMKFRWGSFFGFDVSDVRKQCYNHFYCRTKEEAQYARLPPATANSIGTKSTITKESRRKKVVPQLVSFY